VLFSYVICIPAHVCCSIYGASRVNPLFYVNVSYAYLGLTLSLVCYFRGGVGDCWFMLALAVVAEI